MLLFVTNLILATAGGGSSDLMIFHAVFRIQGISNT